MIRMLLCIALMAVTSISTAQHENNVLKLYETGNKQYQEQKYNEAIESYESLIEQGYVSDDLYANLGTALLRENNLGPAILALEKSLLLNQANRVAKTNLLIAKESIINQVSEIPDFILLNVSRKAVGIFSVRIWVYFHIGFLLISLLLLGCKWLRISNSLADKVGDWRFTPWLIGALLLISFFCLIMAFSRNNQMKGGDYGIVMQEESPLQDGPDDRSNEVSLVSEGCRVKILDQIEEWYKVQLDDKDEGWMEKESITLIKF